MLRTIVCPLLLTTTCAVYGQAHQHGKGTIFIAQDNSAWQLQFTLPSSDIFGFEHAPEDEEQKTLVHMQEQKLSQVANLFLLPESCSLQSIDVENPLEAMHDEQDHDEAHDDHEHHDEHDDEHEHEHDDEHDHEQDDDHERDHAEHSDVEATIQLSCTQEIDTLTLTLFNSFPSLESIDVMWATENKQGATDATAKQPTVKLN